MLNIPSLISRNRAGESIGLPCFCTANEQVIRAVFTYAKKYSVPAVIEATCNQVNQDGGYTGMTPADFAQWIASLSNEYEVSPDNIILGGDHLGPNPWKHLPADKAMEKAAVLLKDYASAGFRKIHVDTSMACGGEPTPSFELVAQRAATLCKIAETHSPHPEKLIYIIGTEVPIPGGETDDMETLSVTSVERLNDTIDTHKHAFESEGLAGTWPKIVSVVTQPGVDFSHTAIHRFQPDKAAKLSNQVLSIANMTFEAHSTDYQPTQALQKLVEQHFFFLKVGPELTFRMREAVFALAQIETQLCDKSKRSELIATIDQAMNNNPEHWLPYYQGDDKTVEQLKHYSYSDRIRYYWSIPEIRTALDTLISNIDNARLPDTIISQYFSAREFGNMHATANELIEDHIALCIDRYYCACGYTHSEA